jgi:cytochrome c biogenesis protein
VQVSHDPAQQWVLVSALTMMAGLLVSLLIKRRRIWARIYPADPADLDPRRTVVELGGLARTDQAGWGDEFDRLCARLLTDDTKPDAQEKRR